jgi:glutamyl-tRNA reductase
MARNGDSPALLVLGTSHRRAELGLRERLHVPPADAGDLAARLAHDDTEVVVLSTCNRTEIYAAGDGAAAALDRARAELTQRSGLDESQVDTLFETRADADAALHLFRVAAGLDSLLPGEAQILGQVREAHELAVAAGATGRVLNRVFAHALHAGKRVRSETGVGTLPAAVPEAAAELAEEVVGSLEGHRVLVIGAGKMGELSATAFLARGVERVFVANHRIERAEQLASRFGGEAVAFDRVGEELERADVVVSSTRCPRAILHARDVEPAVARRGGRPLVLIDIAVPRDLDPAIADLEGCVLYDLDALGPVAAEASAHRDESTSAAETIVAREAVEFREWLRSLDVVPVVTALRRRAEEIRLAELERIEPRLRDLSEPERRSVDLLTSQILSKLLHEPTVRVKEQDDPRYAEALEHLFALDDERA